MLILENSVIAKFGSLADGTIRITIDNQELSDTDTLELIKLYKKKQLNLVLMDEDEYKLFKNEM
jgi:hypothetical protein